MQEQLLKQLGFTLLELMVTVAIAAILMGVAIPSFNATIRSNRLTTYTNDLVTALNLARSEAIRRGVPVTVRKVDSNSFTNLCATAPWNYGWDVFIDVGGDNNFTAGTDVLLRTYPPLQVKTNPPPPCPPLQEHYTIRGEGTLDSYVQYSATGGTDAGSIVICENSDGNLLPEANTSRLITIVTTGRVRIMPDLITENDGIPNKDATAGSNIVSCTPPF